MKSALVNFLVPACLFGASVLIIWQNLNTQGADGTALLQSSQADSVDSALHHLSSSSLVQRAAADCAADSKCIPTVDELVNRAAAACAADAGCVCDWAKYPKKCFLSEVARHKQLTQDAKELVSVLRTREQKKAQQLQNLKSHNVKFENLLRDGRSDLHTDNIPAAKKDLVKAEVQHQLTERASGGHLDLDIPVEQTKQLENFAKQIVAEERERAVKKAAKQAVPTAVTKQLSALSSQIKLLMKKVANNRPERRRESSSRQDLPLTTAEQIRALTQAVAKLTGKVGDIEHRGASMASEGRGRLQELSDASRSRQRSSVERDRSLAVRHQETSLAAALKRGKRAVDHGNPLKAKTALAEVEYYRKAISRLKGEFTPCPACDKLKQEVSALSTELDSPGSSTELTETVRDKHHSATTLEKSFDSYLSVADRALVHNQIAQAQKALHRATGRFAELETMKLPGADAVIKHEMRDALRALRRNIRTQEASSGHSDGVSATSHGAARHWRSRVKRPQHHAEDSLSASVTRRPHQNADARVDEDRTPGSDRLLRKMLARPGYYNAKTLRLATEGLKTATAEADGTLQALNPTALRRIKQHFSQS